MKPPMARVQPHDGYYLAVNRALVVVDCPICGARHAYRVDEQDNEVVRACKAHPKIPFTIAKVADR